MSDVLACLMTCPDLQTAERIARALVEERLAACVNVVPGVRSIYRWKGAVEDAAEVLCVVKTTAARLDPLRARLVELHPYDCPELVALPIGSGLEPYLEWVRSSVADG
jgi:periplasmic divalent cation tolerance protein